MALTTCRTCGHRVSTMALKCPQCGTPVQNDEATVYGAAGSNSAAENNGQNAYVGDDSTVYDAGYRAEDYEPRSFEPQQPGSVAPPRKRRKRIWPIVLLALLLSFIAGFGTWYFLSGSSRAIKKLATDLVSAVRTDNQTELARIYPKANQPIKVEYNKDLLDITKREGKDNSYIIKYNSHQRAIVEKVNGKYVITDSYGLLSFSEADLNFGYGTGWIEQGMSDIQIAERFLDTSFVEALSAKFARDLKSKLRASFLVPSGYGGYYDNYSWPYVNLTVTNNSSYYVPDGVYTVTFRTWNPEYSSYKSAPSAYKQSETVNGVGIAPGGTAEMRTEQVGTYYYNRDEVIVNINTTAVTSMFKENYQPRGDEYEDYLAGRL